MWGLADATPWRHWPQPTPPELSVGLHAPSDEPLVVLLGCAAAGERGRFGVAGIPRRVTEVGAVEGAVASSVDHRPGDGLRVALLGYELGYAEVHLPPREPPPGQPGGVLFDLEAAAVVDHQTRTLRLVGPAGAARARLQAWVERPVSAPSPGSAQLRPLVGDAEHARRIEAARARIAAGDIYQANITRPLAVHGNFDPVGCLHALAAHNPVAHGAYARAGGGFEVLSASMETLATFDPATRTARSFPIKGTRGRAGDDGAQAAALVADPKERAEHVMIVDLVRNDLGRVCVPGTVRVPELMGAHGFAGVWHGVSAVEGTLAEDHTPGELLAALFPGGSITGAPKRRAMQILAELEGRPRGMYTGTIALICPDGRLSASIAIRTLVRAQNEWTLSVGGGIVADSAPERELAEMDEKVAVFRALLQPGVRRVA